MALSIKISKRTSGTYPKKHAPNPSIRGIILCTVKKALAPLGNFVKRFLSAEAEVTSFENRDTPRNPVSRGDCPHTHQGRLFA